MTADPRADLTRRRLLQTGLALAAAACGPAGDGSGGADGGAGGSAPGTATRGSAPPGNPPERPNVLFVFGDAHRASALGCAGNTQLSTPVFDGLAADGVRLISAVSSTPLCKPYRASLMTGRYSHHTGVVANRSERNTGLLGRELVFDPADAPTLGGHFARAGYRCGYVGKWHLGPVALDPGPRRLGFDDFWAATAKPAHRYAEWSIWRSASDVFEGRGRFTAAVETDLALEFLERADERPWFLAVSWGPPHEPFVPPPAFLRSEPVELPPNVTPGFAGHVAGELPLYYGLVEAIDQQMGRLLEGLDAAGVADDTLVIYTSDHGLMLGGHGFGGKELPFAESTSVPFLMRWPRGLPRGAVIDAPLGTPDLLPSLAGLCGIEVPAGVDGADRSAWISGRAPAPDDAALYLSATECNRVPLPGWRGLRTARQLFARRQDGPWFLHDLAADPWGLENRVETHPDESAAMDARLAELMAAAGDSWEV